MMNKQMKYKKFISDKFFDENVILRKDCNYPKISIVTPSYNQGIFLEKTILSILNQNYPNLEYIIIDGGSTDGSVEIIKKYGKYLAYWVSEKDKGQSNAINKGLKICTGDIISWQNSDDLYLPNVFNYISKLFKEIKYDLLTGDIIMITKDDKPIRTDRFVPWIKFGLKYIGMPLANQAAFWSKDYLNRAGLLREDLHYDFDEEYFYRLAMCAERIRHIPEVLGCFRSHELAKANDYMNYKKEIEIVKKELKLKRENMILKFFDKIFRAIYYLSKGKYLYILSPKKDAEKVIQNIMKIKKYKKTNENVIFLR